MNKKGMIPPIMIISVFITLMIVGIVYAVASNKVGFLGYTDNPNALTIRECTVQVYNPLIGNSVITKYTCINTKARCIAKTSRALAWWTLGIGDQDLQLQLVGYEEGGAGSGWKDFNLGAGTTVEQKVSMCSTAQKGGIILKAKDIGEVDGRDVSFV